MGWATENRPKGIPPTSCVILYTLYAITQALVVNSACIEEDAIYVSLNPYPILTTMTPKASSRLAGVFLAFVLAAPAAFAQSTFYWAGGTTNITDGTPLQTTWSNLNGTWGGTISNFATSTNATPNYTNWVDGNALSVISTGWSNTTGTFGITNTLVSNISVSSLNWTFTPVEAIGQTRRLNLFSSTGVQQLVLVTNAAGGAPTINLQYSNNAIAAPDSVQMLINGNNTTSTRVELAGSSGFTKTGGVGLFIQGTNNNLSGTVNILHNRSSWDLGAAGRVQIGAGQNGGASTTMYGITSFNVSASGTGTGNRGRLEVLIGTNQANQLNDSAVVSLAGLGVFEYQGRSNWTEEISQLRLASSGVLDLKNASDNNASTGILKLTNGMDRANSRAQLHVFVNTTSGNMMSTVNLGSSTNLGTNSLLPWATDSRARFLQVDTSNNLVTVAPTDTADVSTINSSTTDYRITGTTLTSSTFASGAQANSIGIYRTNSGTAYSLTVTDTLTIASGGLVTANDNNNQAVTITGGTSLTTANSSPLYLTVGAGNSGGGLTIQTPITGGIDVAVFGGNGGVTFSGSGASTYSGTTYVNGGQLTLAKTGSANAVGSNVVVRSGGILVGNQNNNIPDGATVTVENGGFWNRGSTTEVIASLAGGGMLTANTNSTGITTVTNSVTIGDSGIGTLIVSSASNAGITNQFKMNSGAVFNFDLSGSGGTSDQMQFWNFSTNEFSLTSSPINLTLSGTQVGGTYTVSLFKFYSDAGTTLTSSFITTGLTIGTLGAGITNTPTINYNSGGSTIDLTYEVVPEPSTIALLGLTGLAAIGYRMRRSRRS